MRANPQFVAIVGRTGAHGVEPGAANLFAIVEVNGIEPGETVRRALGQTGVDVPLLREEIALALGIARKDEMRQRLGQAAVMRFAIAQQSRLG